MLRATIIPLILASVLLATATGIPSIIHRCTMAYAAVCQPEACCIEVDADVDPCCPEEAANDVDDDCCVETIVVHTAHTTAVPTTSIELPRLSDAPAFLHAVVPTDAALAPTTALIPHRIACTPYSPPDQAHLGVFLI